MFFLFGRFTYSQSVQDCIGAIPVCQSTYNQANSFSGAGNIIDYTGYGSCASGMCVDPEANSVWYTFQIQTPGVLDFRITPNGPNSDYDWVLFDLTNFSCADLQNTSLYSQMVASCNAANTYGVTGANTLTPNTNTNCQDPSVLNTAPSNNATINVTVGQRYYLNIQNWTGSTVGFNLDFTNSTSSIYDNVPPSMVSIDTNISCNATSITVTFSENVLCNTVDASDFTLIGPNGVHTVTAVAGQACSVGGNQEHIYTLTFSPPISIGGLYTLSLIGPVTDLCGNIASPTSFDFNIIQVACNYVLVTQPTCGASNGVIAVVGIQGSGAYTYLWNTTPVNTTNVANGIPAGIYSVTVSDGLCSSICDTVLTSTGGLSDSVSKINTSCGLNNGSASVWAFGNSPFTYIWDTSPVQTAQTINGLAPGTYNVSVTDASNCNTVSQVTIDPSIAMTFNSSKINETCEGSCNGSIVINPTSGIPPYTYSWSGISASSDSVQNLCSGNYSVIVRDSLNCTVNANFSITTNSFVLASFIWNPTYNITPATVNFISTSSGAINYSWSFGDGNSSTLPNPQNTYATSGVYNLQLIVNSGAPDFCIDTIESTITIYEPVDYFIPNAFTPNEDNKNENFNGKGIGFKTDEFALSIFDRWGEEIFHTKDPEEGWNGKYNGKICNEGIYVYKFKIVDLYNKEYMYVGTVLLLK